MNRRNLFKGIAGLFAAKPLAAVAELVKPTVAQPKFMDPPKLAPYCEEALRRFQDKMARYVSSIRPTLRNPETAARILELNRKRSEYRRELYRRFRQDIG
jgi:hypothetical protein